MRTPRAFSVWWMGLIVGCAAAMTASRAFAQPIARNDSFSTPQGTSITVADAGGVLVNDSAAAGGTLDAVLVTNVANGLLLFPSPGGGGFFYLPNAGFAGNDTFTYQAREFGATLSNVATVTISVVPPNVAPVAADDAYATNEGQTLNVNAASGVLANDTDANGNPLTAALVTGVASGTLTLQANGSFGYVPAQGFAGTVTFTYQANDGTLSSNAATVTITVNAVDDPPVAQADSYTTAEDTPLSVGGTGVLGNDSDPEGAALTAAVDRNVPSGHQLLLNSTGSFGYTPDADFNGTTTFTYRASDGATQSAPTTVTITVTAVNDPPFLANAPRETAIEGVTYRYDLAATDPDGTTPTISAPTLPSWLTFTPPATISGTPGDADVGAHDVTMSITDGIAPAVQVPFRITVEDVDIPPSISPIPEQTATEGTPFDLDLASFVRDSDTAASSLTYAETDGVPAGLSLSAAGRLSGTPQLVASVGTHTVRFTVSDADPPAVPGQFRLVVLPAGRVDLTVAMSASPNPVTLDTPTTWTLTVTNRAPQVQAPGASLAATFAGEVPFRFDAPPPSSGCTLAPNGDQTKLTCAIGPLAGGASATIALTGRSGFAGDVFAEARVAVAGAGALDETSSNDTAVASLSVAQRVAGLPAQRIPVADARAVAAGDFDADGFGDLAVATASVQGVVVFTNVADPTNAGRRTFATPPQSLGGEALTTDIAVADLDRDGDLDIVTAAGNGAPSRAFVSSAGTFTSTALGLADVESRAVAVGDVNGDAFLDLVFANAGSSSVLLNTGSAALSFTAGPSVGPHDARDVLLVDLLGDSLPELVLANADLDGAAVYRNTRGTFTLEARLATGPTSAVATGDFNADNRADLVFARDTATLPGLPSALVMLNTSGANGQLFVSDELGAALTTRLTVRDFDLDSSADVLALNDYGARIYTNESGTFALHPQQLATPAARGVAAGKFSSDERLDLAVVGDSVAIFINDGSGNFGQPDSNPPVIALRGDATVNLQIDSPYSDAGATATDKEDGDVTSRIVVTNTVNTTLLGTYTITYNVSDLSGNAAQPVTRTVNVQPQAAALEGGGGGALGLEMLLALLLVAAFAMPRGRSELQRRRTPGSVRRREVGPFGHEQ
jgi:VCBS repeat-containing protein